VYPSAGVGIANRGRSWNTVRQALQTLLAHCRFDVTENSNKEEVTIEDLRGGAAKAAVADITEKQATARGSAAAPVADNVLALKAAEALRCLCGLACEALPNVQERPVRPLYLLVSVCSGPQPESRLNT
jgi:hypothetical protein